MTGAAVFGDNPTLFLSYIDDGWFDKPFSKFLEKRLRERGILLYRFIEDRRVGEDWRVAAARKMLEASGVLALWTHGGARADGVTAEVRFALEHGLEICLLREGRVPLPPKWPEGKLFVKLRGVDSGLSLGYNTFNQLCVVKPPMEDMLNEIAMFAWRAWAKGSPRSRPGSRPVRRTG